MMAGTKHASFRSRERAGKEHAESVIDRTHYHPSIPARHGTLLRPDNARLLILGNSG
jgi:hypothetical protein